MVVAAKQAVSRRALLRSSRRFEVRTESGEGPSGRTRRNRADAFELGVGKRAARAAGQWRKIRIAPDHLEPD